ncbi:hypothetical protein SDJN02_00787, partial [Cucurbita argyrosperma subsp. argyrosperma]
MFKRCREYREKQLPSRSSMGVSSAPKLSGMQKQFRRNAKLIDRKDFIYIEYLLRRGNKQLDQLRSPATVGLSTLTLNSSPTQDSEH